jgi:hypothetical protein
MMKKRQQGVLGRILLLVAAILLVAVAEAGAIQIDIYRNYTDPGDKTGVNSWGGAPYWNPAGSFFSSDVLFASNTGYNWHPFDLISFGSEITGYLNVASVGDFLFTLDSDDGSMLYIDGALVVNNGYDRGHDPRTVSGLASLSAGTHPFKIEFFEDFVGKSGVDLFLPPGVTYVPEPLTMLLLGLGLLGIAGFRRRVQ